MIESQAQKFQTAQGEVEITLPQMGGMQAGKLIIRLARQHGAAVGKLIGAISGDPAAVGEAIAALTANLDEAEFEALLLKLTKGGQANLGDQFVDIDQKVIERLFSGHTGELFKLFWFGLVTNYENFPAEFAALMPKGISVIPSKSGNASNSKVSTIFTGPVSG